LIKEVKKLAEAESKRSCENGVDLVDASV
jgi:hypothetical protein